MLLRHGKWRSFGEVTDGRYTSLWTFLLDSQLCPRNFLHRQPVCSPITSQKLMGHETHIFSQHVRRFFGAQSQHPHKVRFDICIIWVFSKVLSTSIGSIGHTKSYPNSPRSAPLPKVLLGLPWRKEELSQGVQSRAGGSTRIAAVLARCFTMKVKLGLDVGSKSIYDGSHVMTSWFMSLLLDLE